MVSLPYKSSRSFRQATSYNSDNNSNDKYIMWEWPYGITTVEELTVLYSTVRTSSPGNRSRSDLQSKTPKLKNSKLENCVWMGTLAPAGRPSWRVLYYTISKTQELKNSKATLVSGEQNSKVKNSKLLLDFLHIVHLPISPACPCLQAAWRPRRGAHSSLSSLTNILYN